MILSLVERVLCGRAVASRSGEECLSQKQDAVKTSLSLQEIERQSRSGSQLSLFDCVSLPWIEEENAVMVAERGMGAAEQGCPEGIQYINYGRA